MRRIRPLDLPGRHTYAITQEWEDRHAGGGTFRKPSRTAAAGFYQAFELWEVESLAGLTPSAALAGYTQEWERANIPGGVDRHFRFMFPKDHERIVYLSWKDRALTPVAVRELDETDTNWMAQIGEPRWWTTGVGRIRTAEVYEVTTTYEQGYAQDLEGIPRLLNGSRAYAQETELRTANAYAYTTTADAEAVTVRNAHFDPKSAYTQSWERAYGIEPRFNFTVNLTMNYPGLPFTSVHPWEVANVGGPWIDSDPISLILDPLVFETDQPILLDGLARLVTTEGDTGFGTIGCFIWEIPSGAETFDFPVGAIRTVTSQDRQYLPLDTDAQPVALLGRVAEWRSSESAVMAIEVITTIQNLAETDVPAMIPRQMQKYLRFYVLAKAFGRIGEGYQPILAEHFASRFIFGVTFFRRFTDLAKGDRVYTREAEDVAAATTPPRVRLPPNYPAVT